MADVSDYTKQLGEEICLKVATTPMGLEHLCKKNKHWPCFQTIYEWRLKNREFGEMYAKAKIAQVEVLVDQTLSIADDTTNDSLLRTDKEGNAVEVCNSEWVNRSRLRVQTRQWHATKLAPMIYGDRTLLTDSTGKKWSEKTNAEKIADLKGLPLEELMEALEPMIKKLADENGQLKAETPKLKRKTARKSRVKLKKKGKK
jgi:hypothetical protein